MNAIDEIKRQYLYTVQPVKLFEDNRSKAQNDISYDFISKAKQNGYNPFHPSVENSQRGSRLDILS